MFDFEYFYDIDGSVCLLSLVSLSKREFFISYFFNQCKCTFVAMRTSMFP